MGDFSQEELAGWAGNSADGAAQAAASEQEAAPEEERPKNPAEALREAGEALSASVSTLKGITLPDGEDKKFSKAWDDLLDRMEAMAEEADELAEEHDDLHEDDEEAAEDEGDEDEGDDDSDEDEED